MFTQKLTSVATAATGIAIAISVGFATPASAVDYSLTADMTTVHRGEAVTFTTDAPPGKLAAFFINGVYEPDYAIGYVWTIKTFPNSWSWYEIAPCESITVTWRVYDEAGSFRTVLFSEPYAGSVDVAVVGDNTDACNASWGAGASEPEAPVRTLAKTGSDASAVSALTGVAGFAALTVAVAVARRTRRARRAQR